MELWTRRQTLTPPDDVKAYLMGAFRNKIYKDRIQSNRLPQLTDLPFDGSDTTLSPSAEEALIQDETGQQIHQRIKHLLASLPKRQQEVIYLHFYEGLDADQIADVMGIGRQSVYNLLSRTLNDLRRAWSTAVVYALILLTDRFVR